jgi:hypothetical protein
MIRLNFLFPYDKMLDPVYDYFCFIFFFRQYDMFCVM